MKKDRVYVAIEPHTFGGTKASEVLARILTEKYPQCTTKVGACYAGFTKELKFFSSAWQCFPDGGLMELISLYKHKRFETIKKGNLPEEIQRFLLNVMTVAYRDTLRKIRRLYELNKPKNLCRKYQVTEMVSVAHDINDPSSGLIKFPKGSIVRVTKFFKISEGCYEYVLENSIRVADYYLEKLS